MTFPDDYVNQIICGDCLEVMRGMPDNSISLVLTDPPYGLEFMGKKWDHGVPGIHFWQEALRVAKPGAFIFSFGGDRTHHRPMTAIEDAGWEIRTCIYWCFGSGFPKSRNVSADLRAMPSCSCGISEVPSHFKGIDTSVPPGDVRTGIRTEPVTMPLAGLSAHEAGGLVAEPGGGSFRRNGAMQGGIEHVVGQSDPVMFRSLDMAGVADGNQVAFGIGSIKTEPEPLRDKVVSNEIIGASTINTCTISGDDSGRHVAPPVSFISPSPTTPSGVPVAIESATIINGHAVTRAVDGLGFLPCDGLSAGLAGKGIHASKYTAERTALQANSSIFSIEHVHTYICKRCGRVIPDRIPDGLGTALKPAVEIICLARKPLSEGTVAANVLKWGTGALNIGACRVGTEDNLNGGGYSKNFKGSSFLKYGGKLEFTNPSGRFPANFIHDGSEEVLELFPMTKPRKERIALRGGSSWHGASGFGSPEKEGKWPADDGSSAARFFYCAKASRAEREAGLEELPAYDYYSEATPTPTRDQRKQIQVHNTHPTVKPLALMRYLCTLGAPPNAIVLDPFAGSGSTLIAAQQLGFRFIGIEISEEYCEIARLRLAQNDPFSLP